MKMIASIKATTALTCIAGLAPLVAAVPAFAQADEDRDVIVVTGSYIRGTPEDAASPVDVTTLAEMQDRGSPSIIEMISQLAPSVGGDRGVANAAFANGMEGAATVNLRGLGVGRTLVLMNGRRFVPNPYFISNNGQQFVNINAIPKVALERVEVLKDGGSATYGSDAVAGVVNFITRDGFRGLEAQGSAHFIDGADIPTMDGGLVLGFGNDRLDVLVAGGYQRKGELTTRDRDWVIRPFGENPLGGWSSFGNPVTVYPIATGGGDRLADPACNSLGSFATGSGLCMFHYTEYANLQEDETHWQAFAQADYAISDNVNLHGEFLFSRDVVIWQTSPSFGPATQLSGDQIVVPGVPGYDDFLERNGFTDDPRFAEGALIRGRTYGVAGGTRDAPRRYSTWRANLGLDGTLFDDSVNFDFAATYGNSWVDKTVPDTATDKLAYAYRGLGGSSCDRDAFYADPAGSGVVPGSGNLGTGNCFYYNPFTSGIAQSVYYGPGEGSGDTTLNNPDSLRAWLDDQVGGRPETDQFVADLVFSGETGMELAGGPVGWAAGAQYRWDNFATNPYPNGDTGIIPCAFGIDIGETFTIPDTPINGGADVIPGWSYTCNGGGQYNFIAATEAFEDSRSVIAGFVEVQIPFTDRLNLQVAARAESYSGGVGTTLDPKIALSWDITDSLRLRASLSSAFRAPTINQLGGRATSLSPVAAVGSAIPIDATGNPDLTPETALTTNVGLIWTPPRVYVSVDYWNFNFEDNIILEPFNSVINTCFNDASDLQTLACSRIDFRNPEAPLISEVQRVSVPYVNGPTVKTDGIDFRASYTLPLGGADIEAGVQGTYIMSYDVGAWEWGAAFSAAGKMNYSNITVVRPIPDFKGNAYLNFGLENHNLRFDGYYTSSYEDERVLFGTTHTVEDHFTLDATYNFTFNNGNSRLFAAVNNVFNQRPPFVYWEYNYDPFTFSPFDRTFKVGFTQAFDSLF